MWITVTSEEDFNQQVDKFIEYECHRVENKTKYTGSGKYYLEVRYENQGCRCGGCIDDNLYSFTIADLINQWRNKIYQYERKIQSCKDEISKLESLGE